MQILLYFFACLSNMDNTITFMNDFTCLFDYLCLCLSVQFYKIFHRCFPNTLNCLSPRNDSSDDTMTHSYENETFDETTTTKKTSKSTSKSPLDKLKKYKNFSSPRSPFSARSLTRNSESESEDSISYTGLHELAYYL